MWASCSARGHAPGHAETQLPWCGPREGSAALAQLVERLTRNEKVAGSIPAGGPSVSWREKAVPAVAEPGKSLSFADASEGIIPNA
jgi:hypothetical protein